MAPRDFLSMAPLVTTKALVLVVALGSAVEASVLPSSKPTGTCGDKACNGSNANLAEDAVDRFNLTRQLQSTENFIKIFFTVSLSGAHAVAPGFQDRIDLANCMWSKRVEVNADLFQIGTKGVKFIIKYLDDQSDVQRLITYYRFHAGIGIEYWAAVHSKTSVSDKLGNIEKADVLWGPSYPPFAYAAVSIAKAAKLPIIMWAQDDFVYQTIPGWKSTLSDFHNEDKINWTTNDVLKKEHGSNQNEVFTMSADVARTSHASCPYDLQQLQEQVALLSNGSFWLDPDGEGANTSKALVFDLYKAIVPSGQDFEEEDLQKSFDDSVPAIIAHIRMLTYHKLDEDDHDPTTCLPVTNLKDCVLATLQWAIRKKNDVELGQWLLSSDTPPHPGLVKWLGYHSLQDLLDALGLEDLQSLLADLEGNGQGRLPYDGHASFTILGQYNRTEASHCDVIHSPETSHYQVSPIPLSSISPSMCKVKNHASFEAQETWEMEVALLNSEINRAKALPECGDRGGNALPLQLLSLPEWLGMNRGAPYEMLYNENSEEFSSANPPDLEHILKTNVEFMRREIRNYSLRVIAAFETALSGTDYADMDGTQWDVGYDYVYDVNPPQSLLLLDALQRLKPETGGGSAWFFSENSNTKEGRLGQFTCVAGAKVAVSLGFDEVLVESVPLEYMRRLHDFMDYLGTPEALVLCGGVGFTVDMLLMLQAYNLEPKSVVVTMRGTEHLVASLAGNKVNYILQPLPYPIFSPALPSYLFDFLYFEKDFGFDLLSASDQNECIAQDRRRRDSPDRRRIWSGGPYPLYYSLISNQITAAGSLVTYAAVTKSESNDGFFHHKEFKAIDFEHAFCFNKKMPTELSAGGMGTIRYNCASGHKPGKRVSVSSLHMGPQLSSTRQLVPASSNDRTNSFLDSQLIIVATDHDIQEKVLHPKTGLYIHIRDAFQSFSASDNLWSNVRPLHKFGRWLEKEIEVYPCKPGCYFSTEYLHCMACPPGKYRSETLACEFCSGVGDAYYSDTWASPKCLEARINSIFVGFNETPLAKPGYYQLHVYPCEADYYTESGARTELGDPYCCNQPGVVTDIDLVCPSKQRPYCVNFEKGFRFGTCQAFPSGDDPSKNAYIKRECDMGTADDEYQMAKLESYLSSDAPPCTPADGSGTSPTYPCKCGNVFCKRGAACYRDISLCMKNMGEAVYRECKPGLCIGANKCREGNKGPLCLNCKEEYENVSYWALLATKQCRICRSFTIICVRAVAIIVFWSCCVWLLSFTFKADAIMVVSMRGPILRIFITFFQLNAICAEMIEVRIRLYNLGWIRMFLQILFFKPFDMLPVECLLMHFGLKSPKNAEQILTYITGTMILSVFVFFVGVLVILVLNASKLAFDMAMPMVRIWGRRYGWRAPFYFLCNCFPRIIYADGSSEVMTRSSNRMNLEIQQTRAHSHHVDRQSEDEDLSHCFEAGPGRAYAKIQFGNDFKMKRSDAKRQIAAWTIVMYPVVGWMGVQLIRCTEDQFPIPRLAKNVEVFCYGTAHWPFFLGGCVFAFLWLFSIPAIVLYIGLLNRSVNAQAVKKRASYGVFLQGYRQKTSWWQAWILFRSALLILVSLFGWTFVRAYLGTFVILVSMALHTAYQPFVTCERCGLWYLELQTMLAVLAAFTVCEFEMYMEYKDVANWPTGFHKLAMYTIDFILGCLELLLGVVAIVYGFWLLLLNIVDPNVQVHTEHHGKSNISRFYMFYGKVVHKVRGMSHVIVGHDWTGQKYINVKQLTRRERRFLIYNLKETLQACFAASSRFAPELISIAFHDAFRRATVHSQAKRDAIKQNPVSKNTQDTIANYVSGESVIQHQVGALHHRRDRVKNHVYRLEQKIERWEDSNNEYSINVIAKAQEEIRRQELIMEAIENKLVSLQEVERGRGAFVVGYSPDYMETYKKELGLLVDRLHKSTNLNRTEIEGGITVMDNKGREITGELRRLDWSNFPICARFDSSKHVTVEELSAALADVNMDISVLHPEFVDCLPKPKKRPKTPKGHLRPGKEPEGARYALLSGYLRGLLGFETGMGDTASSANTSEDNADKERERVEQWRKYENEWWNRSRARKNRTRKPDPPEVKDHVELHVDAWDTAAKTLHDGIRLEEETRNATAALNEWKALVRSQHTYNEYLHGELARFGVNAHTPDKAYKFNPLNVKKDRGTLEGTILRDQVVDAFAKRPPQMMGSLSRIEVEDMMRERIETMVNAGLAEWRDKSSPPQAVGDDPAPRPPSEEATQGVTTASSPPPQPEQSNIAESSAVADAATSLDDTPTVQFAPVQEEDLIERNQRAGDPDPDGSRPFGDDNVGMNDGATQWERTKKLLGRAGDPDSDGSRPFSDDNVGINAGATQWERTKKILGWHT